MAIKYRVKLTTVRRRSLRCQPPAPRAHCPGCGHEVEVLRAGQAVVFLAVDFQALEELVAAGRVHAIHTVSGSRWICKDSLFVKI